MRAAVLVLLVAMLAAQVIIANDLHEAAVAMRAASDDYRDSYREYLGEKARIASMLEQVSKDATRMRVYLQKKGG